MKLLTKAIENKLTKFPFGTQINLGDDAEVIVKYFNPCGSGTWLITEAEKQEDENWLLFGYCYTSFWEWGYVSLKELKEVQLPFGLGIERDLYCTGTVKDNMNF